MCFLSDYFSLTITDFSLLIFGLQLVFLLLASHLLTSCSDLLSVAALYFFTDDERWILRLRICCLSLLYKIIVFLIRYKYIYVLQNGIKFPLTYFLHNAILCKNFSHICIICPCKNPT